MNTYQKHIKQQQALKNVVRACQFLLLTSPSAREAREYTATRLSHDEQVKWKLGYFPTDDLLSELTDIVPKKDLEYLNLYYSKFLAGGSSPHGHFSDHNMIMPFYNVHGDIVALIGRCLMGEEERQEQKIHKYKYSTGCQKDLYVYGLDRAKDAIIENDFVIGVEGQFDCIALHNHGVKNAIAFGWANISSYQMFQILRYTNNVVLMFDNDEAGQKAKSRAKKKFQEYSNIKLMSPPKEFKDIDSFLREVDDQTYKYYVIDTVKNLRV